VSLVVHQCSYLFLYPGHKVCSNIDSQRMIIRLVEGRGKDRDLPLSPALLEMLRASYRWSKPRVYLFPRANPTISIDPSRRRKCGGHVAKSHSRPACTNAFRPIAYGTVGSLQSLRNIVSRLIASLDELRGQTRANRPRQRNQWILSAFMLRISNFLR
jgi:hypothetical protein